MSHGDDKPDRVWRDHVAPGVYVETYDDGSVGVDRDALGRHVERKIDQKVGQWTCGCVTQLLAGLALMGMLGGGALYIVFNQDDLSQLKLPTAKPGIAAAAAWDGTSTLICSGNDRVSVSGVTANLGGQTVVHASSNCELTITDCNLTGAIGIKASSNASVTMSGGSLAGTEQAVDASGNAEVVLQKVKTSGARKSGGNAEIQERR